MQGAGALVDVMDALPGALRARGHDVSVALPFYREIRENRAFKKKDTGITVDVQVGDTIHVARYLEGRSASGVQLFFIRCDEFFDRARVKARAKIWPNPRSSRDTTTRGDAADERGSAGVGKTRILIWQRGINRTPNVE